MPEKSRYQLGIEIYQKRIDDIKEVSGQGDVYQTVVETEEVERLQLLIKQNERRHSIFFENKSIFELKSGGDQRE